MTNKEVVLKLQKYLLTQDPEKVTRLCANFFLDLNRFFTYNTLNDFEKSHLQWRNELNMKEVYKFLKDKSDNLDTLFLKNIPRDDNEGAA